MSPSAVRSYCGGRLLDRVCGPVSGSYISTVYDYTHGSRGRFQWTTHSAGQFSRCEVSYYFSSDFSIDRSDYTLGTPVQVLVGRCRSQFGAVCIVVGGWG